MSQHDCKDENCLHNRCLADIDKLLAFHQMDDFGRSEVKKLLLVMFHTIQISARTDAIKEIVRMMDEHKKH